MNKLHSISIRGYNKLHSSGKIIQSPTEGDIRIQRFPDIIPAVNQDPENKSAKPKLLAARAENRGTQSLGQNNKLQVSHVTGVRTKTVI